MDITKILNKNRIDLNLNVSTKLEAIEKLSDLLLNDGVICSKKKFIQDIYLREKEGETGIGNAIAIPHGKSDSVLKTSLAIGRNKIGLDWETLDDEPVKCIILFAVRKVDSNTVHIKLLSKVAGALAHEEIINSLLNEENPEKIIQLFENVF